LLLATGTLAKDALTSAKVLAKGRSVRVRKRKGRAVATPTRSRARKSQQKEEEEKKKKEADLGDARNGVGVRLKGFS